MGTGTSPGQRTPARGAVLIEAALVIPIALLMLFAAIELGRVLTQYLALSRIAYEGARFGSSLPGLLEGGVYDRLCEVGTDPNCSQALNTLRERIWVLINRNDLPQQQFTITAGLERVIIDEFSNEEALLVRVDVTTYADTITPIFGSMIPLKVSLRAPYLFPGA